MIRVSLIVPTRGRAARCRQMIESALDLAHGPDAVEFVLGIDADDSESVDALKINRNLTPVIYPRGKTVARTIDRLWVHASGAVMGRMDDDLAFDTHNWDEAYRDMADASLSGYGLFYPQDVQVGEGFVSLPAMTRRMMEAVREIQSFVTAPWFPFWFTDTWWDELGDMTGFKAPLAVKTAMPEGRGVTTGMRDLVFWAGVFERTRPQRIETARKLIERMYRGGLKETNLAKLKERAAICAMKVQHLREPGFVAQWEANAGAGPSERYDEAKREAEALA